MKTITKKQILEYLEKFKDDDVFFIETDCYYEPEADFILGEEIKFDHESNQKAYPIALVRSGP